MENLSIAEHITLHQFTIITSITDDVLSRLEPIVHLLQSNGAQLRVILYDFSHGANPYDHLLTEIDEKYHVSVASNLGELLRMANSHYNHICFFLLKHSVINPCLLTMVRAWLYCKAEKKHLCLFQVNHVRLALQGKGPSALFCIGLALRSAILFSVYYLLNVGAYLCLRPAIQLLRRKATGQQDAADTQAPRNILFIRMDHLGDIICTLPALRALRDRFPRSRITFLGASWSTPPLTANLELYDELLVWDAPWHDKSINYRPGPTAIFRFFRFLPRLRRQRFDLIIQPRGEGINVLLALLAGGRSVVSGLFTNRPLAMWLEKFIDIPVRFNAFRTWHIAEWPQVCLERMHIPIREQDIRSLYHPRALPNSFQEAIQAWREKGFRLCIVVIGAGSPLRSWTPEKYAAVLSTFYAHNIVALLIGTPAEKRTRDAIVTHLTTPFLDLVGLTGFDNLPKLLTASDLLLTLDTSIMHLASLLNVKIIALFGAGNINLSRPYFNSEYVIIKKELGCSGCGDICPFQENNRAPCMEQIEVEDVLNAAMTLGMF